MRAVLRSNRGSISVHNGGMHVAWSFLPVCALATGCVAGSVDLEGRDGGPALPGIGESARYACIELDEDFLRFVNQQAGERHEREAIIRSHCDWDVQLTSMTLDSDSGGFSMEGYASPPTTLRARDTYTLTVVYVGSDTWPEESGSVQFAFDDQAQAHLRLTMRGDVVAPRIELDRTLLEFGDVVYESTDGPGSPSFCASELAYLRVKNVGYGLLHVGTVVPPSPFEVEYIEVGGTIQQRGPFVLERNQRAEVAFRYTPTAYGEQRDVLRLLHDAPEGVSEVNLAGRGIDASPIVETFHQGTEVAVDILWAIDSSGSMEEEQARLVANLGQFVDYAEGLGADYQMAVIEAQELESGAGVFRTCAPHPPVVGASYLDNDARNEAFSCMVEVGTMGFATETAAGATRIALERAQSDDQTSSNPNAGFLRPHADLAIVAISDEDDQSLLPDDVLLDAMFAAKDFDRSRVRFHAIAGPLPMGCPFANRALRYSQMVDATGGMFFGICADDWSPLLTSLGLDVFRPRSRFGLKHHADELTLDVRVDGAFVPRDAFDGYAYDPDGRWITFSERRIPPPGSEITVTYVPHCPR